ncbi:MAG: tetratricopeptide repeat protein [Proteobacteria bacterium]|nr:MAG: tetratricopeptide repeat protein [Pseudomonadota bacterium]
MTLIILSAILQIACCVHVIRNGRPLYWIFILLAFSFIAVAIYFFAEVMPGLQNDPAARKVVRKVKDRIDPEREKRSASQQFGLSDTQATRRRLSSASLRRGDFQQAVELYRGALKGLYETDPEMMMGLAKAQFGLGQAAEARATLDALIAANPNYRSKDAHLLYARTVEASSDITAALHEYESVVQGYPGEEARVRYGMLLVRNGEQARARDVFNEILTRSAASPKYYQREQREWIDAAKRELSALR